MNTRFRRWTGDNELTSSEMLDVVRHDLPFTQWRPSLVTIHHTGPIEWYGMESLNALEATYRDVRGWSAGPHFYVSGRSWYLFTPANEPGVHSPTLNATSIGIRVVHDGDAAPFNGDGARTLWDGVAGLFGILGLHPIHALRFHRDDPRALNTCPGLKVTKSDFIGGVLSKMLGAPAAVTPHPEDGPCEIMLFGEKTDLSAVSVDGIIFTPLGALATALGATLTYKGDQECFARGSPEWTSWSGNPEWTSWSGSPDRKSSLDFLRTSCRLEPDVIVRKDDVRVDLTGRINWIHRERFARGSPEEVRTSWSGILRAESPDPPFQEVHSGLPLHTGDVWVRARAVAEELGYAVHRDGGLKIERRSMRCTLP